MLKRRRTSFRRSTRRTWLLERLESRQLLTVTPWTVIDPLYSADSSFGISSGPSISDDGQLIAFQSTADNLVPNDTNGIADVFLYDRSTRQVRLLSVNQADVAAGTSGTVNPVISPDGRYVAFESDKAGIVSGVSSSQLYLYDLQADAVSLVTPNAAGTGAASVNYFSVLFTGDSQRLLFESQSAFAQDPTRNLTNDQVTGRNIFERNLATQQTFLVSVDRFGHGSGIVARTPISFSASHDGRYVAFATASDDYSTNDVNGNRDVFVRDVVRLTNTLVSTENTLSAAGNSGLASPSISQDGRFVTFVSDAALDESFNPHGSSWVYVRDLQSSTTSAVKLPPGREAPNFSVLLSPVISGNGRSVVFATQAQLIATDTNNRRDVYVYDLNSRGLNLVSVNSAGTGAADADAGTTESDKTLPARISVDGRYVFFRSAASNLTLVPGSTSQQLFRRDLLTSITKLVTEGSRSFSEVRSRANGDSNAWALTPDGRTIAFESLASNLPGTLDDNGRRDIFVRELDVGNVELASRRTNQLPEDNLAERGSTLTSISSDGRLIAFTTTDGLRTGLQLPPDFARNIDVVDATHVLVRDTVNRTVQFVDLSSDGLQALGSDLGVISGSGRYVAFRSNRNLDRNHPNTQLRSQVFVRDLQTNSTLLISRGPSSALAEEQPNEIAISSSGRYVAWTSRARVLVDGITGDSSVFPGHIFLWDKTNDSVRLVDHVPGSSTQLGNGASYGIVFSPDESRLAFVSAASNLQNGVTDSNNVVDLFVYTMATSSIATVSTTPGNANTGNKVSADPNLFSNSKYMFSANGQYLFFTSNASNLVTTDTNNTFDVFRRDLINAQTVLVSSNAGGTDSGNRISYRPSVSADGQRVVFESEADNLTSGMVNRNGNLADIFVRDFATGITSLVSSQIGTDKSTGNDWTQLPTISPSGRYVSFVSFARDLVTGFVDGNGGELDLFMRDLQTGTTQLVTHNQSGTASASGQFAINVADVRFFSNNDTLFFNSTKPDLIPGDRNGAADIFSFTPVGTGSISGKVFLDANGNGLNDNGEAGQQYWLVYLERLTNDHLDADEIRVQTDNNGNYAIDNLAPGTYHLRVVTPSGYRVTTPDPMEVIISSAGQSLTGRNVGVQANSPDLAVTSVIAPSTAHIGKPGQISFTVQNKGTTTEVAWQDAIYLSPNRTLDGNAIAIAVLPHTGLFQAGQSYTRTLDVNWPATIDGEYYVIVASDRRRQVVSDADRTNNFMASVGTTSVIVPTLVPNQDFNGDGLSGVGTEIYYKVEVPANSGTLAVRLTSAAATGSTALYLRKDTLPSTWQYDGRSIVLDSPNQLLINQQSLSGTYYVMVRGESGDAASAAYTLRPELSTNLRVLGLDRSTGAADSRVTIGIRGLNFTPTTTAQLVASEGSLPAANIVFHDQSLLYATFAVGRAGRTYSLELRDGSQTDTLANALIIVPSSLNTVRVRLIAPERIRYGRQGFVVVEYANEGQSDLPAPLLEIRSIDHKAKFRNPEETAFRDYYTQLYAASPDGPAGILRPGQSARISIPFVSVTPIPHDPIDIEVTAATPLAGIDWESLKSSIKPSTVQADAWEAIWSNFKSTIGNTTEDYAFRISQAATYLGELGVRTSNLGRLFGFLINQADASYGPWQLPLAVDAQLSAPGLALTLDRNYMPSISGRYQRGMFGRGWTTKWESRAINDTGSGTVIIQNGSMQRTFVLQYGGIYRGVPGDFATLTSSIDGLTLLETSGQKTNYSNLGKLQYVEDPNGNRITCIYDISGRLIKLEHSSGPTLTITHNAQNRVSSVTDSAGRVTMYAYDAGGSGEHLQSVTTVQGTTQYQYITGQGLTREHALSSVTLPDGTSRSFAYDSQGRLSSSSLAGGAESLTFAYLGDAQFTMTDSLNHTGTVWLNDGGRLERISDANGKISNLDYNAAQELVRRVDPLGAVFAYSYDTRGNLSQVTNPLGFSFQLNYSATGLATLNKTIDARGNVTTYDYDTSGNLRTITYPAGGQEAFNYDPLGNLLETVNRRGNAIKYTHDSRGRKTRVDFFDGSFQTFTYDPFDNLTTAEDSLGVTVLEYDDATNDPAQNRLTKITYPGGHFLVFSYDSAGRRTQSVDQDGFTVKYSYDAAGRLSQLLNAAGSLIVRYTYDAAGQLIQKDNGNGTRATFTYDPAGQLLSIKNFASGGQNAVLNSQVDYTYDAAGRRTSMSDSTGTTSYGYDAANQLTRVAMPGGRVITYQYDPMGNRTRVVDTASNSGQPVIYETNSENEITKIGSGIYRYDADGNLQSIQDDLGTTTYTFNDLNQLTSVGGPTSAAAFTYSPLGFRTSATRDGIATTYLIDPLGFGNVVGEYRASESIDYVHGLGLVGRYGTDGSGFYDFDALGNTLGITGSTGSYLNQYHYLPFGQTSGGGTFSNPFTFSSSIGLMQENSQLFYGRVRYLLSGEGQYISNDPLGLAAGFNARTFVNNNPVLLVDASGMAPIDASEAFGEELLLIFRFGRSLDPEKLNPSRPISNRFTPQQVENAMREVEKPLPQRLLDKALGRLFPKQPPPPPSVLKQPVSDGSSESVTPNDPNDLIGPTGFGDANYTQPEGTWPYLIEFENKPDAAAPAQDVIITHQLDADLDWNSLELGSFGFGAVTFSVPQGFQQYETSVDYFSADGSPLRVQVASHFNRQSGLLTVEFRSLDPATGVYPEDPLAGFLPAEDGTTRGQGFVQYIVRPKANLASGVTVDQQAAITFDANDPLSTPTFTNTIDSTAPTSAVSALPTQQSLTNILVSWSGADAHSGIATYDVYVSDNESQFSLWQNATSQLSSNFTGQVGHSYRFYSVATDNVGNVETAPVAADAITQIIEPAMPLDDQFATVRNQSVSINVMSNDQLSSWTASQLTVSIVSPPAPGQGTVQVLNSREVQFVPATNYVGQAVFTYRIVEPDGTASTTATVTLSVTGSPKQNPWRSLDVNASGSVTPLDALLIINLLNNPNADRLVDDDPAEPPYLDVNGDGVVSPIDALLVINELNAHSGGEGEAVDKYFYTLTPSVEEEKRKRW